MSWMFYSVGGDRPFSKEYVTEWHITDYGMPLTSASLKLRLCTERKIAVFFKEISFNRNQNTIEIAPNGFV